MAEQFNFGDITEVCVLVFFTEIFAHLDVTKRKFNQGFDIKSAKNTLFKNLELGKYKFNKRMTIRHEDINGDTLNVYLKMKARDPAVEFINNFSKHKEYHDIIDEILLSLCNSGITSSWFLSRSAPFKQVHDIIDVIVEALKNPIAESISITVRGIGVESGKKSLKDTKITSGYQFVVKSDVSINAVVKEKKTNKVTTDTTVDFSIKGDSKTVESTSVSALLSALYKMTDDTSLREYCVSEYQDSLMIRDTDTRSNLLTEIFKKAKSKSYSIDPNALWRFFEGTVFGGDKSQYFKVSSAGVQTIDRKSLKQLVVNSKSAQMKSTDAAINLMIKDGDEFKTIVTFAPNSKKNGVNINIPKWYLT